MSKFNVIYADPPWDYGKTSWTLSEGGGFGIKNNYKKKENQYPTMSNEQLKNLEIDPFGIVYADPPWRYYDNIDKAVNMSLVKQGETPTAGFSPEKSYPTMSNSEISALPIKDIVAKDAACFMWTTDTHMPAALEIMKAWGFTYKTIAFVWIKKHQSGKQVKMLAPWTMKGSEICLLGTRGAMTQHKKDNTVSQIVEAVRGRHSQKPLEVARRIERLFPDLPKIELFARDAKPGWACWGNEVSPDIQLTAEEIQPIEPKKKVVSLF